MRGKYYKVYKLDSIEYKLKTKNQILNGLKFFLYCFLIIQP